MKNYPRVFSHPTRNKALLFLAGCIIACLTGCGGGSISPSPGPNLTGNTSVTLLATSTANNKLSKFGMDINSITLTNAAGGVVSMPATPQDRTQFISVNGTAEPLLTVSVPQGIYVSATASIGSSGFVCVYLNPSTGGLEDAYFSYGYTLPSQVTVNLPAPITITGTAEGLALDLQVAQSATWTPGSCSQAPNPNAQNSYTITPTFNLTPVTIAAQPTNSTNGKSAGLLGLIASVDASSTSFNVVTEGGPFIPQGTYGPNWSISTSSNTVYQGVAGFSQLAVGMPVDMDVALQADGSLLATRVAVYDTDTTNLTMIFGPLQFKDEYVPELANFGVNSQGYKSLAGGYDYSFSNATFLTSGQFTNLQSLPFTASFTAANMVAGQNVFISTHTLTVPGGYPYIPATTMTLLPQTLNGTVSAIGSSGNFTTYTITLASYDLFPALAVQPGQTTLLTNPSQVVVYADNNTQMLNTNPIAVGSVVRFYGLVFNDNDTLRMDCAQILDGVSE